MTRNEQGLPLGRELELRLLDHRPNKGTKILNNNKAVCTTKSVAKSAGGNRTNVSLLTEEEKRFAVEISSVCPTCGKPFVVRSFISEM